MRMWMNNSECATCGGSGTIYFPPPARGIGRCHDDSHIRDDNDHTVNVRLMDADEITALVKRADRLERQVAAVRAAIEGEHGIGHRGSPLGEAKEAGAFAMARRVRAALEVK